MKNAIDYLTEQGWQISSDPRKYDNYPKNYGYRNYQENGINYDAFCDGYHRAFDVYNNKTNDVPAVTSGTVVTAETHGNFGGTIEIRDANGNDWIYGHLQRNSFRFVKGDKVNQGDIIGLQGSSNYYDNPMAIHLHIQLRPKGTELSNEKIKVCAGMPIEKYDISKLNQKLDQSHNGGQKQMKDIYSNHIKGNKLTNRKASIAGIIIHNDYGSMTPSQYLPWLYSREQNGQYVNGWASVYVNRDEVLWYHPTNFIEWHAGHPWANANLIGFEVCESYPGRISDKLFLENEEATLKVAAAVMKSYGLPVNRNTVRLHREFFGTSCPHRSWDIHVGKGASNTQANRLKLIDYFIKRLKHYYNDGQLPDDNKATTVEAKDVESKVEEHKKEASKPDTDWKRNQFGTWYKREQATFTNGNQEIQVYYDAPFRNQNKKAGKLPPNAKIKYDYVAKQDGHVWVEYEGFEGEKLFLPVRTWNSSNNTVGKAWGAFSEN